jgi:hypothetical protein
MLFIGPNQEDYLADGLLHGLRTLLGADVVDVPKAEFMYSSYPDEKRPSLYGRGFTLYTLLDDLPVERRRAFDRVREGCFDAVVFADIWRTFGSFVELLPALRGRKVAVVDGADNPEMYPYGGYWWRTPQWWTLPRAHTRAAYFKREITSRTFFFRTFMVMPPRLAERLPVARRVREIAFSIPEEKIVPKPTRKEKDIATHVVDPEVARRLGRNGTTYAFADESAYYGDLQASRYGITVKRAGWDCLRHYEIAANGCVPCFRDLDRKPPRCAPHGLNDGNCIAYRDHDDLMAKLERVDDAHYRGLQAGALDWARANTTRVRAKAFLATLGLSPASSTYHPPSGP